MLHKVLLSLLIIMSSMTFTQTADVNQIEIVEDSHCVQLATENGLDNPNNYQYELRDLNNNIFYAQVGKESGFMVYDSVSDNFIEKSTEMSSPYDFDINNEYYYFGPFNYYKKVNDTFVSLTDAEYVITMEEARILQNTFDSQLSVFRNSQSDDAKMKYLQENPIATASVTVGDKTYIDNYQYIRDDTHPYNYDGTCGFVAGAKILNYWNKTMLNGLVLPQYYDASGQLNSTSYTNVNTNLKDKLVSYGGDTGSWGLTVRDALIDYCREVNVAASSAYYIGKIGLDSELANDRPVIIFGALPDEPDSNLITHAVTCYGVENTWWGGYYIVNYGWGSSTNEVSLGFGFVGSVTTFQLNEEYYKSQYTIQPNDWGFENQYYYTSQDKNVTVDGLDIETSRLRCGYIENEYINLSPRRENAGTAYLELEFENPVYQLDVYLSFWSNNERYGTPNEAVAMIQYQKLCETPWITSLDLLTANLPTDRYNQTKYTLYFPGGTRKIRFYSHFDYMSGLVDRNKGRISIGDITIYTYN